MDWTLREWGVQAEGGPRKQVAAGRCTQCVGCGVLWLNGVKKKCPVCGVRSIKRLGVVKRCFFVRGELQVATLPCNI